MRLFTFSLGAFAASAIGLMAMFLYALNVPTKAALISPETIDMGIRSQHAIPPAGPEKWAAINLKSVLK